MKYLIAVGAADVSDAAGTDQFLVKAPAPGKIKVDGCFVVWTEATGAMTVDGVLSLKIAGTEVGTCTPADSNTIGDTNLFAVDGTVATAANPWVNFTTNDAILVEIKTQATGVTTGDGTVYLEVDLAE